MTGTLSHTWLVVKPLKAWQTDYFRAMGKSALATMAENLSSLRDSVSTLRSQVKLAKRAGIGEGTVSRARRGDGNTTVKNLDAIAKAYKIEAWQLLKPGLGTPEIPSKVAEEPAANEDQSGTVEVDVVQLEEVDVVQLLPEQVELAKMWMKLDERDRMKFKRELFAKALQHADEVPDERLGHLSAAEKQKKDAAASRASQGKPKSGKGTQ